MADHYIYESPDRACLCQGDILERSAALIELLGKMHPQYANHPSYGYFVVVTQTCDLACRDGCPPSSPYITITAARPVEEAIVREAKKHQEWWEEPLGLLDSKEFDQMVLFTESLLNNNVPNYFYLHEDLSLKISGQHCAFLALAITLKIDNYKICRDAKIAQIKEVFRAKLGWLIGNMYSRIGTRDWDDHYGKNKSRKEASQLIKDNFAQINKEVKDRAIKELAEKKELSSFSPEEIFEQIKNTSSASRLKRFSDRMTQLFQEEIKLVEPICSRLIQDIQQDDKFAAEIEKALLEHNADEIETTLKEITKVLSSYLRSYLSEQFFPGREKLSRKIMETIKQDSIIKNALA